MSIHPDLKIPNRFDGAHYDHERDFNSLAGQLGEVYRVLSAGEPMTVGRIAAEVSRRLNKPVLETSISANVRNLRSKCGLKVPLQRNEETGLYEYRLVMETEPQGRLF